MFHYAGTITASGINREDMKCHNILDSDLLSDISQFLHMLTLITAGKY